MTETSFECSTERLLLRRPVDDDLDAVFLLHSDPATYAHNPATPDVDIAASQQRLQGWIDHWSEHDFGYLTVQSTSDGTIVGFACWPALGRPISPPSGRRRRADPTSRPGPQRRDRDVYDPGHPLGSRRAQVRMPA